MEGSNDWAHLPIDLLPLHLNEPEDFVCFRAVCPQWRAAMPCTCHVFFQPWIIVASPWHKMEYPDNIMFYSLSTEKTIKVHVPNMKGKRVATPGSGYHIDIDKSDDLSGRADQSITQEITALPRLPDFLHNHNPTFSWVASDEGTTTASPWCSVTG
ncbi:hypothetical protein E2562_039295 [Oryza meyeriana var. granulata]|uniref:F-box domain-containing protein n=1 Tax=Oryza meyeriana var. granulata TaxID=110450 RepID=A0A6G1E9T5_9ORYZ|nr:hypothetical protein E2562_039295 [Oryza meyeriana var. granulata]